MSITRELIEKLTYELQLAANQERQDTAAKIIDYYHGVQLDHLEAVLDNQFSDPDSLKLQLAMDNITAFVGDEISRVFDENPTITASTAAGQKLLDTMLDDGTLFLKFKLSEVYANLTTLCAISPWWDEENGIIKNTIIPNSALFVSPKENDPSEPECVTYVKTELDTIGKTEQDVYVHWDDENHFLFDDKNPGLYRSADPATNPDMINPYGIIPFAFLRDSISVGSFFNDIDEHLTNAQETLNVRLTEINQITKFQGFSIPVMLGMKDVTNPIAVDPSKPLKLPATQSDETQPDFKFVTSGGDLSRLRKDAQDIVEQTISRYGISTLTLKLSAQILSGYAMKIANQRLDRLRLDSLPLVTAFLRRWWLICKTINNYHNPRNQVPIDDKLNIDYVEPTYAEDPATRNKRDAEDWEMGLTNPVEIMLDRNPDLTPEEAIKKYEYNLSMKTKEDSKFGLRSILRQK